VHELFAFTVIGIVSGAAYAVAASGLVVTYTTSGVFNIAHGAVGMAMAFMYWQLRIGWGWPTPLALAAVLVVIAPAFGALVERVLVRRVRDLGTVAGLVVTIGLMVLLIGLVNTVWKPQARYFPEFFGSSGFTLFGVRVSAEQAITVGVAVGVAVVLRALLYRTRLGVAMRAVVDDEALAATNGARPAWLRTCGWAIGSSLAALAGILIAPTLQLSVLPLTLLVVDAYAAAMVGRLRSLPLTFAGAIGIGLLQSYAVGYMPSTGGFWGSTAMQGLRLSIPAVALFAVLLVLPGDRVRAGRSTGRVAPAPASLRSSLAGGVLLVGGVVVATGFLSVANVFRLGTGLALGLVMLSLVPLTGWGGQISLCQMTLAGLGAFAMVRVSATAGPAVGLLASAGLAGAAGALIALPALRLRGLHLALATMAFATAMDNMFFPAAVAFTFDGSVRVPRPAIFAWKVESQRGEVVLLSVVFAVVGIGLLALRRGRYGRLLAAARDSEAACQTLGLDLTTTKVVLFGLSAALAGLGGALYGGMESVAGSTDFMMLQSLPILLLVVVGGVSTAGGALLGGLSLGFAPLLQSMFPSVAELSLLGSGLAGIALASNPDGLVPGWVARARLGLETVRTFVRPQGEAGRLTNLSGG
jgi:branched-chain amino acid transport system permease protein